MNAKTLQTPRTPGYRMSALVLLALLGTALSMPSQAQYKVIGADGRITYTDQPPLEPGDRMSQLKTPEVLAPSDASLPADLRQAGRRYPVTLYTSTNCDPCDSSRQYLRQRGIPYTERVVTTADDGDSLQRLTGARDLPSATIGAQVVRGFSSETWGSYLDAAGYPKTSKLPPGYQFPPAVPLSQRTEAPRAPATARPPAVLDSAREVRPSTRPPTPADNSGIRF